MDTHYKTIVVLASATITLGGWWAWNGFLSSIYAPDVTPYAVRNGFSSTFGPDPAWWLTLAVLLGVLATGELGYRALKRNLIVMGFCKWRKKWSAWAMCKKIFRGGKGKGVGESDGGGGGNGRRSWGSSMGGEEGILRGNVEEWRVELWQEIEKDVGMREMLRRMGRGEGREEPGEEDTEEVGDDTMLA